MLDLVLLEVKQVTADQWPSDQLHFEKLKNYEKNIQDDYLEKINAGYLEFLRSQNELNVKIIDISDRDFVKYREDYIWLLKEINSNAEID